MGRKHTDDAQERVEHQLFTLFEKNKEPVFYSRQLEVHYEDRFFHWITNRALHRLTNKKFVKTESRDLRNSGNITLYWHKDFRYYRRTAKKLVELVEEYADPNISGALGLHAELMILEGFAKAEFILKGRNCNSFNGRVWGKSNHDLDFIIEKDGLIYGVEIKNMLGYMDYEELGIKIDLCKELKIIPVFVARMLPKTWINEVITAGGFALILKYQLYPITHKHLSKRVANELGLPVDSPRALAEGTIQRFVKWHNSKVNFK